jgi:hypothetical protein
VQQIAGCDEVLEPSLEGGTVLARDAQNLHQLACGGWMMNALADPLQKIVRVRQR